MMNELTQRSSEINFFWFNVVYVKKVELMKTTLFTLYALDM